MRALALVALWLIFSATGCSNTTSKEKGGGSGGAKTYKVAGIGFQDDQFYKLIELGLKDGAEKTGVDLKIGTSANSLDKEISLLETYTASKVDAICIAPLSATASIPALKRAHEAGIKVVTFDSILDADFQASNIKSDQIALGRATGEAARKHIEEKMGGKANIAILAYMTLAPEPCSMRVNGFKEAVSKLPGVTFVAQQDAWLADKAVNVTERILTANPEVNLIWAANEGGTVGAVTAVKNAGKQGQIVVFGTDMSEQMAGFLLSPDNILQAVTGQKPFEIGSMAVQTVVKALKGEAVEKQVTLSGQLFERSKPDEVTKYRDYLRSIGTK